MALDSCGTRGCPTKGARRVTFVGLLLVVLGALTSCFGSDGISQLFGDDNPGTGGGPGGGQGGFDPGTGGGVILRDLFQGARVEQSNPSVVRSYPADGDSGINVKAVLALEFSESVDGQTAAGGIRVFAANSNTAAPGRSS